MKILVFAPYSAIWVHAFPEALVVEALQQEGHEIFYLSCGGQFKNYCNSMTAHGLSVNSSVESKESVCKICRNNRDIIRRDFGFKGEDLVKLIDEADRQRVNAILDGARPDNYLEIVIDQVHVAQFALYEFLLNEKKNSVLLTDDDWTKFKPYLENTLFAFYAAKKVFAREKPDRVIVYNSYYAANHIFCRLAEAMRVPQYSLHAGENLSNRMQTLSINGALNYNDRNKDQYWQFYKQIPSSSRMLSNVTDHFLTLFKGKDVFAYSAPKASEVVYLRKYFGVSSGQRVLLATMSSEDERFAVETVGILPRCSNVLFPTQIEWVTALIEYAKINKDLFLIIRVHPRDFPNKRENVKSVQASVLEELFSDLPNNVGINWPAQQISLYDLAEITDVVLNGWSSAGKEMTLLGIPVVIYSSDLISAVYPADLNYLGETYEAYFAKIEQALIDGWSFENILKAYRWFVYEHARSSINIAESYPYAPNYRWNIFERLRDKFLRRINPSYQQLRDCRKRAPQLKEKALINRIIVNASMSIHSETEKELLLSVTEEDERKFVIVEITRLVHDMYGDSLHSVTGGLADKFKTIISC